MTITICHNKAPDRKYGWTVDDVRPRRDGPENLRKLKKTAVEFSTVEACGCIFRISNSRDELRS